MDDPMAVEPAEEVELADEERERREAEARDRREAEARDRLEARKRLYGVYKTDVLDQPGFKSRQEIMQDLTPDEMVNALPFIKSTLTVSIDKTGTAKVAAGDDIPADELLRPSQIHYALHFLQLPGSLYRFIPDKFLAERYEYTLQNARDRRMILTVGTDPFDQFPSPRLAINAQWIDVVRYFAAVFGLISPHQYQTHKEWYNDQNARPTNADVRKTVIDRFSLVIPTADDAADMNYGFAVMQKEDRFLDKSFHEHHPSDNDADATAAQQTFWNNEFVTASQRFRALFRYVMSVRAPVPGRIPAWSFDARLEEMIAAGLLDARFLRFARNQPAPMDPSVFMFQSIRERVILAERELMWV